MAMVITKNFLIQNVLKEWTFIHNMLNNHQPKISPVINMLKSTLKYNLLVFSYPMAHDSTTLLILYWTNPYQDLLLRQKSL